VTSYESVINKVYDLVTQPSYNTTCLGCWCCWKWRRLWTPNSTLNDAHHTYIVKFSFKYLDFKQKRLHGLNAVLLLMLLFMIKSVIFLIGWWPIEYEMDFCY